MNSSSSSESITDSVVNHRRLYYLDWLRIFAMLSIFFYHSDRFFDIDPWHINNSVTSLASTIHIEFFKLWMMPLFFIISGAAVYYSLRSRKVGGFVRERCLRILIPWITIGIFVMAPPQIYLMRVSLGEFSGNFFQFYQHYFEGVYPYGGNFAFHGMHLWYLMDLFIFSLILLPFFLPWGNGGKSLITRLATLFEKPWGLLLLLVPLVAVAMYADMSWFLKGSRVTGGWDMLSYLLFFIYGYLIFSNIRIQKIVKRYSTIALVTAIVSTTGLAYIQLVIQPANETILWALRSLCAWCWLLAILGFGSRFLNFNNKFLSYANEAVLPFYILHQTVITIIGFYVIQWNLSIALKYFIIVTTSFIAIMAVYELLVRRINVLRFLFGMRLKKKK